MPKSLTVLSTVNKGTIAPCGCVVLHLILHQPPIFTWGLTFSRSGYLLSQRLNNSGLKKEKSYCEQIDEQYFCFSGAYLKADCLLLRNFN